MPRTAAPIPSRDLPEFRRALLGWFYHAKRDLEWRRTRDPYRIWISEIMLQQTRVATVTPYYRRFVARFPTVRHLARAPLEAVLRNWAGLGYYSRARNLHRAAKLIVKHHGAEFPRDPDDALALPGIGSYTAAAVLSIAYGAPLPALDGNVARVLSRFGAIKGDLRQPKIWRRLTRSAGALLASDAAGDWNQALMELGAMVCTPHAPQCRLCPIARWCHARALGLAEVIPSARKQPKAVYITVAAAVLLDSEGRTLLLRHKSPEGTLFSRMWQFPAVAIDAIETRRNGRRQLAEYVDRAFGITDAKLEPLPPARHTVTFRCIQLAPFVIRVARLPTVEGARTPALAQFGRLPISNATRKIAESARGALESGARIGARIAIRSAAMANG